MMRHILIYGSGGFAREVAWLIEQNAAAGQKIVAVAFVDDNVAVQGGVLNELPIISFEVACQQYTFAQFVIAIGSAAVRKKLLEKIEQASFTCTSLIQCRVEYSRYLKIDTGTIICAGSILTTNIILARQVHINLDCTIGHDVVMQDFVTLAPGVHVSGWVILEEGAYIGTGANIINGSADAPLVIGAWSVIGSGACVTRSIPPYVTAVGIPAKPLSR